MIWYFIFWSSSFSEIRYLNASPITKITSWLKLLAKNLHLAGSATLCSKSEVMLLNKYHALLWLEFVTFMLIKSKHKRQTWIHKHLKFDGNSIDFCFGFQKQNRIWEKCVVHEMGTTSPWWLPLAISIDRWFSILGILAIFGRKSSKN